jgi:Fe2+ or Zn2+ uptake regulation protein
MTRDRVADHGTRAGGAMAAATPHAAAFERMPERLRARGLRWTAQRATLFEVLAATPGHVTGSRLVERCRELDPATTPSTVYRTLDVLEALGVISHSHGIDGREEFHVLPVPDHGHLICSRCGTEDELAAPDATPFLDVLGERYGFLARIDHLTVVGLCRACRPPDTAAGEAGDTGEPGDSGEPGDAGGGSRRTA